ncbi:MAG: [FeFe] hydrogenase H-cluster maturation GTPase HydF [Eubacterium sp.]|nr:[FeFe] hydrogenase H-cluster maturation GTPase HydF [Eubacterium sp.]
MSLNSVPSGERVHIAFFGCRNAGKSSLVNAFTSQNLSIVSDVKGTTTDPVKKAMELLPLGPVVIIDTPGIDDEGTLGQMRISRAKNVLAQTDIAILVTDASSGPKEADNELIKLFKEHNLPFIVVKNKCDLLGEIPPDCANPQNEIYCSALSGYNINELKEMTAAKLKDMPKENPLISDLVNPGDIIVLVIPIDKSAPKGRLILPQQQVIRDALDSGAVPVMCRETELENTLLSLKDAPKMVITDSQAFKTVAKIVPESVPLTSFSILMARYKGNLSPSVLGAAELKNIKPGDKILISEGCTHHRQCEDIGAVKLPKWIREFTGSDPEITLSSGTEFPENLGEYKMIIHCGACMLNAAEAKSRYQRAIKAGVPITNYGTAIAYMNGILKRSLSLFPDLAEKI